MQRTPAGLPLGIPKKAEEMLGAIQQAPQPNRHSILLKPLHQRDEIVSMTSLSVAF